jgi:NADH:ubiquinone oxidoreductase subunit 2 (subunit N)
MLAFLPIISSEMGVAFENTIKYFIIQRCASIIFLFGVIFCLFIRNRFILIKRVAIFFKLGAAPFHGWFISILKRCSI